MKQWFLLVLIAVIPISIAAGLTYSFVKWVVSVVQYWRMSRELDEIRAYSEAARARRQDANAARLSNGCHHAFDTGVGFPPGACPRCGLEQEKPSGSCDHVWKQAEGPVPGAVCTKCGRTYRVQG